MLQGDQANSATSLETFKSANSAGREALRSLLLLNGGGAVAMLAFIGTLANSGADISSLRVPLASFAVGSFFAVVAAAFTYFSAASTATAFQFNLKAIREDNERRADDAVEAAKWKKRFDRFNGWAVASGVLALVCFLFAVGSGYCGFDRLGQGRRAPDTDKAVSSSATPTPEP